MIHPFSSGLVSAFVLALISSTAHAERTTDPLGPLVQCVEQGSFKPIHRVRLAEEITGRTLKTPKGDLKVSTADGYRMVLGSGSDTPFASVKLEQSRGGLFAQDRAAILELMQDFSTRRAPGAHELQVSTRDGVEIFALDKPNLDARGPISFYTVLSEKSAIVATVFLLNQDPKVRAFQTMAEYEALRDKLVNELSACLRKDGASASSGKAASTIK